MAQPGSSRSNGGSTVSGPVAMAQKNFELNNDIIELPLSEMDRLFGYDSEGQRSILKESAWKTDVRYFTKVRISAVGLVKMVMHARSGGIYEIMGLMVGKVDPETRTIYVMDSFPLPVEGTETRVNAQNEAYEYMVQFLESNRTVGRNENVVGWYHSHPGYGCWLSGIDVSTQRLNQQFQDPFVAIVVDPNRTVSSGKVDIGAFRTYPEGYSASQQAQSGGQSSGSGGGGGGGGGQAIPLSKIEDFGVHANEYYPLEVEHFKSSLDTQLLDLLWNKYWQNTLSDSPLVGNRPYVTSLVQDLADKLARSNADVVNRASFSSNPFRELLVSAAGSAAGSGSAADVASGSGSGNLQESRAAKTRLASTAPTGAPETAKLASSSSSSQDTHAHAHAHTKLLDPQTLLSTYLKAQSSSSSSLSSSGGGGAALTAPANSAAKLRSELQTSLLTMQVKSRLFGVSSDF
ncbi:Mov34-domain-containing protein [Testicularia cyperi]|uniref:COP9 signalosome complex subunit 5 n=1 Tax=Testicularia cyperi TaxID=1882483 RepID=A0A317XR05_9BASI|nr:Mov34-domain-containing protein [Testicularia cyperi]